MKAKKMYRTKRTAVRGHLRVTAMGLIILLIFQIGYPTAAMALTSGPKQPEASDFTPADVSNLVDPFTGDFSYNIPMFDIGGYPVNLSYNSGVTMDQEASWVGLGWNLNTGAITRDVRGLPDDFWGDEIKREFNTKPNITAGGSVAIGLEFAGAPINLSYGVQMKYNNYAGLSVGETFNGGVSIGGGATNVGLGLSTTNGGLDINPNIGFRGGAGGYTGSLGIGLNINSRTGLSQMSLNGGLNTSIASQLSSFSGTISFLNPTWTPQNVLPYNTNSFTGNFKIGGAVYWGDISGTITGFYTKQSLITNSISNPAYGYLYSEKGQFVDEATHDFNREKDGPFTNNTPALPITNYTYDAFNIKAQGIGGSFRAFRNDVGHVFDPEVINPSVGGAFGAEVDFGNMVDLGVDINVNYDISTTGKWKNQNAAISQFKFTGKKTNSIDENVFFKLVGEKVSEPDNAYLDRIQKDNAVSVQLEDNDIPMALNQLHSASSTTFANNNFRQNRMVRNTSVQCFTVEEVKTGFPNYARYLPDYAPDHHIAMIVVTTADGTRYVFGLPAYNKTKREVTMAVGTNMDEAPGLTKDANNMTQYSPLDASVGNQRGIDNYYDVTETPAFVYTWYLTEVLSPDYSDLTGDGPTEDDLGGYVKFSYGETAANGTVTPNIKNYKWRTPSSATERMATFNTGLKSLKTDDRATYLYGEKDIWYPSAIESKTQLVKFEYANRMDGLGVTGEHGVTGGSNQKRIDQIKVYSRQDYVANTTSAIPLKTIHFEYDYSLCPDVFNNNGGSDIINSNDVNTDHGKLTLKKVYFTYRNSSKAKYSSYSFEYPSGADNPAYDPTAGDRWGGYRGNSDASANEIPLNEDFPYTLQDQSYADRQARCWNLEGINLPTGGKIHIDYESDDYAYVQDRKACRMFQVAGAGKTPDAAFTNMLYDSTGVHAPNNYLFFKLENPIPSSTSLARADEMVKEKYFFDPAEPELNGPTKYLYFRFLLNANKAKGSPLANEYVSGYADVDAEPYCGVWTGGSGDYEYGWVKLKGIAPDGGEDADYNPISKTGWAFSRINTPFYANDQPVPGESSAEDFLRTILNASIINQLMLFFQGPNNKLRKQGFASQFVIYDNAHPEKGSSWIRLYEPDGFKLGGGHRVKRIKISDNWEEMEGDEDSFEYGQEYVYVNEDGNKSSGVASFEPMYGADENPFRIPAFYNKEYGPLIPDDRFYLEEPFGECFFPSPSIGYSRVKIMNLQRNNVTKTATGYTQKEFYTAKDFPTKTHRTDIQMERAKISPLLAIFSPYVFDFMTNSQGFSIELNDMHGKPKIESVYQEGNDDLPISFVQHFYLEESETNEISNSVPVLEKNGTTGSREIGTEIDLITDFRESNSSAGNIDIGLNLNVMLAGIFPLFAFTVFPNIKMEDTRYRSVVTTKVINRYAIEVRTEATDLGSLVTTENKYYNGISGEPLVTQVNNAYDDARYTVSIPAYWSYPAMGHGSKNEGFVMLSTTSNSVWNRTSGAINYTGANLNFQPGDEVIWYKPSIFREPVNVITGANNYYSRLWVAKDDSGPSWYFIDRFGEKFTYSGSEALAFKIVRSGNRNILDPKIAEFAMLEDPLSSGSLDIDEYKKVLSVTAQTFGEQWKMLKRYTDCEPDTVCVCQENPWAVDYMNMLRNILNTGTVFNQANGASNGNLLLYNSYGYYNGFNQTMLDYFESISGCTVDQYTRVFLHKGSSAWNPLTDTSFLNGTEVALAVHFTNPEGYNCNACTGYNIALVDPGDVPAEYFSNPNCYTGIDGIITEGIMFIPVVINEQSKFIKMFRYGDGAPCGYPRDCEQVITPAPDDDVDNTVNPYIRNILGKWRAYESYTFLEDREGSTTAAVNLRRDGFIHGYSDFWHISGGGWTFSGFDDVHWKRTTTITQYHPSGPQVEEKNALDIYSAAQYGYFEQLAVAVAQNSKYKEMGFDGFEDYVYLDGVSPQYTGCTKLGHFRFDDGADDIVTTQFHTGKRSLRVVSGSAIMERNLQADNAARTTRNVPYVLETEDLLELFGPSSGLANDKPFVFSFWVKQDNASPILFDYTSVSGDIKIGSTSILSGPVKKSPVINGWQKFEYIFTVPASSSGILKVELNASGTAYFDDVRIHPFNGMMKSYVYDPLDLRFMAELDENNYATFYEYDEDGALVRIKKETERGIMTIQENRYGSYKN